MLGRLGSGGSSDERGEAVPESRGVHSNKGYSRRCMYKGGSESGHALRRPQQARRRGWGGRRWESSAGIRRGRSPNRCAAGRPRYHCRGCRRCALGRSGSPLSPGGKKGGTRMAGGREVGERVRNEGMGARARGEAGAGRRLSEKLPLASTCQRRMPRLSLRRTGAARRQSAASVQASEQAAGARPSPWSALAPQSSARRAARPQWRPWPRRRAGPPAEGGRHTAVVGPGGAAAQVPPPSPAGACAACAGKSLQAPAPTRRTPHAPARARRSSQGL